MGVKIKPQFYAYVLLGLKKSGVVRSWKEAEAIVKGKPARYRGFATEAAAKEWLNRGAQYEIRPKAPAPKLEQGIYFDAGTGRGKGVEVKVTDEKGTSLLPKLLTAKQLTEFSTHRLKKGITNNYGELLGCKFAFQLAEQLGAKKIFGDSRLVIEFWSKGFIKKDKVPPQTKKLSQEVKKLRKAFEERGGEVLFISGDFNPADLGFHQ